MSNNTNLFERFVIIFALSILVVSIPALAQNVESMSGEVLNDVSADELYWVVEVVCEDIQQARLMQQRAGENAWCSIDFAQLCEVDKRSLAQKICAQDYQLLSDTDVSESRAIEQLLDTASTEPIELPLVEPKAIIESVAIEPATAESTSTASSNLGSANETWAFTPKETLMTAEEIAIEEELIQVEQQLLELRLREIELEQL